MLVTSTSVQPAPLAMRLRREAICARPAMLMAKSHAAHCPHCSGLGYHGPEALSHHLKALHTLADWYALSVKGITEATCHGE